MTPLEIKLTDALRANAKLEGHHHCFESFAEVASFDSLR